MNLGEKFNFCGPNFDSGHALQNPDVALQMLPCRNGKTFNNLDEYYKKTVFRVVTGAKQEVFVEPERKFTIRQIEACKRSLDSRWKELPDVLNRMDKPAGPLLLLKKSLGLRVNISVHRRKLGARSSPTERLAGQLVAFDKHLSLILIDVDRVIVEGDKIRQRYSKQLFVRGDSIIYVGKC